MLQYKGRERENNCYSPLWTVNGYHTARGCPYLGVLNPGLHLECDTDAHLWVSRHD